MGGGLVKAIALQGVSFEMRRCQSIILLHVISQLCTCVVPIVTECSSYTLYGVVYTVNEETTPCVKRLLTRG